MTTIKQEVSTQQFIAEFGDHELVHEFSVEAIEAILNQYKRVQSESRHPASVDWESLLNDALEWDALGVVYELRGEIGEHASIILDTVRTADVGASDEIKAALTRTDNVMSDYELFQLVRDDLMKIPALVDYMAAILAKKNGFTKLGNGKYIILGAY